VVGSKRTDCIQLGTPMHDVEGTIKWLLLSVQTLYNWGHLCMMWRVLLSDWF
jgi:hypothetical protein